MTDVTAVGTGGGSIAWIDNGGMLKVGPESVGAYPGPIAQAQKAGREILVKVEDTGSGISAEFLPHVFERGVSTRGTGFGLYLCRTVVESLGGRIWMESVQGSGTLAAFVLPTYEGQFGGEAHG